MTRSPPTSLVIDGIIDAFEDSRAVTSLDCRGRLCVKGRMSGYRRISEYSSVLSRLGIPIGCCGVGNGWASTDGDRSASTLLIASSNASRSQMISDSVGGGVKTHNC